MDVFKKRRYPVDKVKVPEPKAPDVDPLLKPSELDSAMLLMTTNLTMNMNMDNW